MICREYEHDSDDVWYADNYGLLIYFWKPKYMLSEHIRTTFVPWRGNIDHGHLCVEYKRR